MVATRCKSRTYQLSRSEEHTSELQSPCNLVCRLLLEKKKKKQRSTTMYITCQLHCAKDSLSRQIIEIALNISEDLFIRWIATVTDLRSEYRTLSLTWDKSSAQSHRHTSKHRGHMHIITDAV